MKNDLARLLQQSIYLMNHKKGKASLIKSVATMSTEGNKYLLLLDILNFVLLQFGQWSYFKEFLLPSK